MIRNLLAVAVTALATSAVAADLPSHRAPPVFLPPPPVFTWTGYYIGATAGYAFDSDSKFFNGGTLGAPGFVRSRASGFTGGGEIGYNYEFANTSYFGGTGGIVIGAEADAAYVGPGSDRIFATPAAISSFHSRMEFVGTVRGRLGYAFDNILVYGTGGFAYGGVDGRVNIVGASVINGNRSTLTPGYAYGGGIAYALPTTSFMNPFHSSAVTLKAEFIRYDLATINVPLTSATGSVASQIKTQGNLVRAGIDYKIDFFARPTAPILAKY